MLEIHTYTLQEGDTTLPEEMRPLLVVRREGEKVEDPSVAKVPYLFSSIGPESKWTEDAERCLVNVVSGRPAEGPPISFMTHVSPGSWGKDVVSKFYQDYDALFARWKAQVSIDQTFPLMAGGVDDGHTYENMMASMSWRNMDPLKLKVRPDALAPSTRSGSSTSLYLDTEKGALYVLRAPSRPAFFSFMNNVTGQG